MILRRKKQESLKSFRILFYPEQSKYLIYQKFQKHEEQHKHYSLLNGEHFYSVCIEANSPVQALSLAVFKLEDIMCGCERSLTSEANTLV